MLKQQRLDELYKKMLACTKCALQKTCSQVVPGEGSVKSEIVFIGEGPGKKEDEQGRPFIGSAGKFLDELIATIGLKREDVYIANTVKCRPPSNRDPLPKEKEICWHWLVSQLEIIKPKIIIPLGRHSLEIFLPEEKISEAHGQTFQKTFPPLKKVIIFPSYHPAAALYNGSLRGTLLKDFKKIPKALKLIKK
ncbi:MAG: uracil-DNA glycosylase [Patescibacteria group bacterium]|jgi:uracil-DNA glycosylase family 4|nr:uracil-DNA glycosylase [Patescibacteria group bacterium]